MDSVLCTRPPHRSYKVCMDLHAPVNASALRPLRTARHDAPPLRGGVRAIRIAAREQDSELVREQLTLNRARALGPITEAAHRQALQTQPESLPVIREKLDRRAAAIAEHEHRPREWVRRKRFAAHAREPVDPATEVDGHHGDAQPHLRRELNHRDGSQNARASAATSTTLAALSVISRRSPSRPMKRTTVCPGAHSARASTSTNPSLASPTAPGAEPDPADPSSGRRAR